MNASTRPDPTPPGPAGCVRTIESPVDCVSPCVSVSVWLNGGTIHLAKVVYFAAFLELVCAAAFCCFCLRAGAVMMHCSRAAGCVGRSVYCLVSAAARPRDSRRRIGGWTEWRIGGRIEWRIGGISSLPAFSRSRLERGAGVEQLIQRRAGSSNEFEPRRSGLVKVV